MTPWIEHLAMAWWALACLVAALAARSLWAWHTDTQIRCPGPDRWWTQWVLPWCWRRSVVCGYDLRGLHRNAKGQVRCPECGARSAGTRRAATLRVCGPWIRALLLLCLAGLMCRNVSWLRSGGWTRYAPTALLATTAGVLQDWTPKGVRGELEDRMDRHELAGWQEALLIEAAIRNLGNDSARHNADWGIGILYQAGDSAIPAVEAALLSRDYQRRQLAAWVLINRWWDGHADPSTRFQLPTKPPYVPPDALFRVVVEGLADDDLNIDFPNASSGMGFLVQYGRGCAAFLLPGLRSADPQQRFLSAVCAGLMGATELVNDAGPILVEHLMSNDVESDAAPSARALYLLGPEVLPYVRPACECADGQAANLAKLIVMNMETPGAPRKVRRELNTATVIVDDPTLELDLDQIRSMVRWAY